MRNIPHTFRRIHWSLSERRLLFEEQPDENLTPNSENKEAQAQQNDAVDLPADLQAAHDYLVKRLKTDTPCGAEIKKLLVQLLENDGVLVADEVTRLSDRMFRKLVDHVDAETRKNLNTVLPTTPQAMIQLLIDQVELLSADEYGTIRAQAAAAQSQARGMEAWVQGLGNQPPARGLTRTRYVKSPPPSRQVRVQRKDRESPWTIAGETTVDQYREQARSRHKNDGFVVNSVTGRLYKEGSEELNNLRTLKGYKRSRVDDNSRNLRSEYARIMGKRTQLVVDPVTGQMFNPKLRELNADFNTKYGTNRPLDRPFTQADVGYYRNLLSAKSKGNTDVDFNKGIKDRFASLRREKAAIRAWESVNTAAQEQLERFAQNYATALDVPKNTQVRISGNVVVIGKYEQLQFSAGYYIVEGIPVYNFTVVNHGITKKVSVKNGVKRKESVSLPFVKYKDAVQYGIKVLGSDEYKARERGDAARREDGAPNGVDHNTNPPATSTPPPIPTPIPEEKPAVAKKPVVKKVEVAKVLTNKERLAELQTKAAAALRSTEYSVVRTYVGKKKKIDNIIITDKNRRKHIQISLTPDAKQDVLSAYVDGDKIENLDFLQGKKIEYKIAYIVHYVESGNERESRTFAEKASKGNVEKSPDSPSKSIDSNVMKDLAISNLHNVVDLFAQRIMDISALKGAGEKREQATKCLADIHTELQRAAWTVVLSIQNDAESIKMQTELKNSNSSDIATFSFIRTIFNNDELSFSKEKKKEGLALLAELEKQVEALRTLAKKDPETDQKNEKPAAENKEKEVATKKKTVLDEKIREYFDDPNVIVENGVVILPKQSVNKQKVEGMPDGIVEIRGSIKFDEMIANPLPSSLQKIDGSLDLGHVGIIPNIPENLLITGDLYLDEGSTSYTSLTDTTTHFVLQKMKEKHVVVNNMIRVRGFHKQYWVDELKKSHPLYKNKLVMDEKKTDPKK